MAIADGEFRTVGGDVQVIGDFYLGPDLGEESGSALFSLTPNGEHTVIGEPQPAL